MSDLIERQAAIDAVDIGNLHRGIVEALQNIISELPSAQRCINPNVSGCVGHWVWKKPSDDCRCSICEKIADQKYPYCPWCGARMEGEDVNACEAIADAPVIDAVPVVRCRNCTWFDPPRVCLRHGRFVENSDWYCADGERREK